MRKFLFMMLLLATACQKSPDTPFYSASFSRTINAGSSWSWNFTNKTANLLSFTQTYYTGSLTTGKQSRWTIAFVDPQTPVNLTMVIPGIDSSAALPVGKDMSFAYRSTQNAPLDFQCSLFEKGSMFSGSDSCFLDIQLLTFSKGTATGTFSIQMFDPGSNVDITDGHFTNIPITFA
ncbi:MAG TPA: hypothetical protein VNU70_13725, partial [Puia sp.]|nr:hypothetical protein [Puia sp.]